MGVVRHRIQQSRSLHYIKLLFVNELDENKNAIVKNEICFLAANYPHLTPICQNGFADLDLHEDLAVICTPGNNSD